MAVNGTISKHSMTAALITAATRLFAASRSISFSSEELAKSKRISYKNLRSIRSGSLARSLITSALMVVPAATFSVHAAPLTVTKWVSQQEQAAASANWTREKLAAVRALPMPVDHGLGGIDPAAAFEADFTGPGLSTPAGTAEAGATLVARAAYPQDWVGLEKGLQKELAQDMPSDVPTGTSSIFTSYDVNTKSALWKIYPHLWIGRLTFTTPSGGSSCSATAISNNHIVTAAHCVYDSGSNQFYSNWVFAPAFRNGNAPYGTFAAQSCTVPNAWINLSGSFNINSWSRHDVAVCRMGNNSAGQTLNGAVGWAGRLWNAGNSQLVFNSGYPARSYTDATISNGPAQYLRSCTAETFLQTTETLGSGCEWGRGISGGSWLVGYKPFLVTGQVNSVNSGLFVNQQNLYGARFSSSNIELVCNASGC